MGCREFRNQLFQNDPVSGTERILGNLCSGNPAQIVVFQFLGLSLRNGGVIEGQMNGDIGIFMNGFHKNIPYGNGDPQFFLTLPD